jgi:hypothetical protein
MGGFEVTAGESGFFAMYVLMVARQSGFEYVPKIAHQAVSFRHAIPPNMRHSDRSRSRSHRERRSGGTQHFAFAFALSVLIV